MGYLQKSDLRIRREDSYGQKQAKKKPWIKPETFEMIEKKRECKRDSEEYKDLKTTVRKMLRLDRNAHLTAVCDEMEEHQRRNRTKDMFQQSID